MLKATKKCSKWGGKILCVDLHDIWHRLREVGSNKEKPSAATHRVYDSDLEKSKVRRKIICINALGINNDLERFKVRKEDPVHWRTRYMPPN
jgi:hypothetical protein